MKIKRTDAHDRYEHFTKQDFDISSNVQSMMDKRPFGDIPFYIFAHTRTVGLDEQMALWNSGQFEKWEEMPTSRLIWQPRLTKPQAQPNSMLFKGYPGTDNVRVIWILPRPELWDQYGKDNMTNNELVFDSIQKYKNNKGALEARESDDLPDEQIDLIYRQLCLHAGNRPYKMI